MVQSTELTCKCTMHSALAQDLAIHAVVGGGRDGPNHVGGVDVLDVAVSLCRCRWQAHIAAPSMSLQCLHHVCHLSAA